MIRSNKCYGKGGSETPDIKGWFRLIFIASLLLFQVLNVQSVSAEDNLIDAEVNILQSEKNIKGKVVDETGQPMPGVAILIKGTTTGTITNIDGVFNVEATEGDVLVVSFIGMVKQEIVVGSQSFINVVLVSEFIGLDDVVVVGYGSQKKATLTGSIDQVKGDVFQDKATSSPILALQGQSPGLVVTRGSSRPGNEDAAMKIRGETSINGGDVLIIIDGVPSTNNEEFYNMNTNDIESISVLKDGSAAIYGSRAANGVILVTTKRGKSGDVKVEYTGSVKVNTIGIRPPSPNMQQYATVWLEAAAQDKNPEYWGWLSKENLELMQSGYEGIYETAYWGDIYLGNYSRFDEMYGTSVSNQHDLSISGGNEVSGYRLSLGYSEDVGALKTAYDGKKRQNIRFNHNYQLTDWFKLESSVVYTNYHVSSPSTGLGVNSMASDPPLFPAQNPYGQWYGNFGVGDKNATASTVDGGRENKYRDILSINLAATVDIYKDLKFKGTAALRKEFQDYQQYVVNVPQYTWFGEKANSSVNTSSSIRDERKNYKYQNYGGFFVYDKRLNDHHFSATAGLTAELSEDKTTYGYRKGFVDIGVYDINLGSVEDKVEATGGQGNVGFYSYVGRFNYSFKDKYLFELQGRRDGSSKFYEDNRWSNFYGGSLGWILTEENFMQNVNFINFLKLRASYGQMGGQQGVDMYDYISSIKTGSAVFGQAAALQNTASIAQMTSNDRTWESISDLTFGVDFHLLDSKLQGTFDYYKKKNDGMFINITYPSPLGGQAPPTNSGVLDAHGWEASLRYHNKVGELEYSIGINMSDSRNTLTDLDGVSMIEAGRVNYDDDDDDTDEWVEGKPINALYLYETDGLFADDAEVQSYYDTYGGKGNVANLTQDNKLRPGDVKVVDQNGDDIIDSKDLKYMGDASPHYVYGINLGLKWKGLDFSSFFQGVLKQNTIRTGYMSQPFYSLYNNQTTAYIGKTWTPENTGAEYPRMTAYTNLSRWNWQSKDFGMQNNRYVRLKSLVLGYTFNNIKVSKYKIDRLRFYFSGNDLFEFTSVKDGYDPESGESTQSSYPFTRTWSMGVNLSF